MKRTFIIAALALAVGSAETTWAQGAGAYAPAQISPGANGGGPRVLVVPFTALNVPPNQQWVAKGVQEDVIAELGHAGAFAPIAFQGQVLVEDNATAARLARQASAPLAVRGAAQIVGDNVRLTAQLIDANTGDTLNTASATGPFNDLLKLEDELSAQLRGVSATGPGMPPPGAPGSPTNIQPQQNQPQVIVVAPPNTSNYTPGYAPYTPTYVPYYGGYPSDYSYYPAGYSYPYYFPFSFYVSYGYGSGYYNGNYHHDDHHGGGNGHWGGSGGGHWTGGGNGNWGGNGNGGHNSGGPPHGAPPPTGKPSPTVASSSGGFLPIPNVSPGTLHFQQPLPISTHSVSAPSTPQMPHMAPVSSGRAFAGGSGHGK